MRQAQATRTWKLGGQVIGWIEYADAIYFTSRHVYRHSPESGSNGGAPKSKPRGKALR